MPRGRPKRETQTQADEGDDGKIMKKPRKETFATYIYRVLKKSHPDVGMNKTSMTILNAITRDLFEMLAIESGKLCRYQKKKTLSHVDIIAAVKLHIPEAMALPVVEEIEKNIENYRKSKENDAAGDDDGDDE